jgi:hypothetical protein
MASDLFGAPRSAAQLTVVSQPFTAIQRRVKIDSDGNAIPTQIKQGLARPTGVGRALPNARVPVAARASCAGLPIGSERLKRKPGARSPASERWAMLGIERQFPFQWGSELRVLTVISCSSVVPAILSSIPIHSARE